jgi:hypothetical protein
MPHGNRAFGTLDNDDVLPSANLPNAQGSRHRSISSGFRNISKSLLTRAGNRHSGHVICANKVRKVLQKVLRWMNGSGFERDNVKVA